jgi:heme/copper-type cytochrome/quinol oxidase subunit 2
MPSRAWTIAILAGAFALLIGATVLNARIARSSADAAERRASAFWTAVITTVAAAFVLGAAVIVAIERTPRSGGFSRSSGWRGPQPLDPLF